MDDKTKGVGSDRTSGRADEYISGREALDTDGRLGERGTSRIPDGPIGTVNASETTRNYASGSRATEPEQRTREIRAEIEQTRDSMSETVNAIQDRLRPANLASSAAESVKNTVRNAASETVREVADTARNVADKARDMAESEPVQYVRANPVATAMVGIGIVGVTWLALGGRQPRSRNRWNTRSNARDWRQVAPYDEQDRYYRTRGTGGGSYAGETQYSGSPGYYGEAGYAGETGYSGEATYGTAPSSNPDLSYGSREDYLSRNRAYRGLADRDENWTGQDLSRRFERTTREAQRKVQSVWQENPLMMGAASVVLGVMVGMAAPQTDAENDLMGEARDNAVEGVQQTVRQTVNKVQEAAASALGADQPGQPRQPEPQSGNAGRPGSQGPQSSSPGQQPGGGF